VGVDVADRDRDALGQPGPGGGLVKNAFLMQIYADVLQRPISVVGSDRGPALGSAIHAAVAAGAYPDVPAAAAVMGRRVPAVFTPDPATGPVYDQLFAAYRRLHDHFGRGGDDVMHELAALRRTVNSAAAVNAAAAVGVSATSADAVTS
jgi:L-ribulokinase